LVEILWVDIFVFERLFRLLAKFLGIGSAMEMNYRCALCIFALSVTFGCAAQDMILESKDVQFFKVDTLQASPTKLKISGLAFKSAMSVKDITATTKESVIVVRVYLAPASSDTSGSFAYELTVPPSVNEVRFGTDTAPIWKRGY
jgi:hypothetical protein